MVGQVRSDDGLNFGQNQRTEEEGSQWRRWRDGTGNLFDDLLDEDKREMEGSIRISGFLSGWVVAWSRPPCHVCLGPVAIKVSSGEIQQAFSDRNLRLR